MAKLLKVFLSHANEDKKIVRRISRDLTQSGIEVWIDETSIKPGQSIGRQLEDGLAEADYLLVLLSTSAISSKWVRREWEAKLHLSKRDTLDKIIPVLLEECEVPPLLQTLACADFRSDYETGISGLLHALHRVRLEPLARSQIFDNVADALDALAHECIIIPFSGSIPIIQTLKRLPRSGKHLRLEGLRLADGSKVPSRSLYDHILSVAHSADCFFDLINHEVPRSDISDVSRCIAYHELNEIILGDIPAYTDLTDKRRHKTRIDAERRLRTVPSHDRERIANEFLRMFLDDKNREAMDHYLELTKDRTSKVFRFYKALDKIDPIIGVWRYLHFLRGKLDKGPDAFIAKMHDFFDNHEPKKIVKMYMSDTKIFDLVSMLQVKSRAKRYYEDSESLFQQTDFFGFSPGTVKALIEGKEMLFVEEKHLRRFSTPHRTARRSKRGGGRS